MMNRIRLQLTVLLGTIVVAICAAPSQAQAIAMCDPAVCNPPVRSCATDLRASGEYVEGYACNTYVSSLSYYKGWGNVRDGSYCVPPTMYAAWTWTGSWSKGYVNQGTRVYIWPFATDWSWVWTAQTGWRAMRDVNLVINKWRVPWAPIPMCASRPGITYAD
jgi:hypothetical protein